LARRHPVTVLDEPTNDLDRPARETLYHAVRTWPGVLIVVSHDRELLECVDAVVELRDGRARTFGGTFAEYEALLSVEQDAAERRVRAARGELRREQRQQVETQAKLAQRRRTGAKAFAEKREPRIVMRTRKRQAQVSAAKYRAVQDDRVEQASRALDAAKDRVRDDRHIRIELPATQVPAGRTVLEFDDVAVRGPERIAIRGRNGAGKTTLLRRVLPLATVPVGYLPQRLDVLDPDLSVLDNVRRTAPVATPQDVRAGLARFLLRGARVELPARALSGGELFRATLATLLLADPAPQLLALDEPTNNLDLDSVAQLVAALRAFRGALLVVSHDERFLTELEPTGSWTVRDGRVS
jgi:ATPase subunit of ABC transporter with duplicated ATPase domains